MTTMTLTNTRQSSSLPPALPLLLLMGIVVTMAAVVLGSHAVARHPDDAPLIRQCLNENGPYQVWASKDRSRFFKVCQLPDMRWGFQITAVEKATGDEIEITAYVKNDGSWTEFLKLMAREGAKRFTGVIR